MDIIIAMSVSFCILILSIYKQIFIGYPLIFSFFIFAVIAQRKGFDFKEIMTMAYKGGKKSFVVLKIFFLIGAITAIWMSSGTVPGIVYYGIKILNPKLFILYSFLSACVVSFLIGTSFGTASTVGVAFIVMAKSGNVNINVAAGAIIAGAYFGDRCSPMSSSANLVANLTDSDLYKNIKNMFKSAAIPFIISVILYALISFKYPLNFLGNSMDNEIINIFTINFIVLIPAAIILIFAMFKIDVKISMLVSIIIASVISIVFQGYTLEQILKYMLLGFKLENHGPLETIIRGGGLISMGKAILIVFVSSALGGIFEGTGILKNIENLLMNVKSRVGLFFATIIVSIATSAFGCNQSISIILTSQLTKKAYDNKNIDSAVAVPP